MKLLNLCCPANQVMNVEMEITPTLKLLQSKTITVLKTS